MPRNFLGIPWNGLSASPVQSWTKMQGDNAAILKRLDFTGVGYNGPFKVELSSAQKYGFLERPSPGTVSLTDRARQALRPQNPGDSIEALTFSFRYKVRRQLERFARTIAVKIFLTVLSSTMPLQINSVFQKINLRYLSLFF